MLRVWMGIILNLALDMLLGTPFINRFIRVIIPFKLILVRLHFYSVAVLVAPENFKTSNTTTAVVNILIWDTYETDIDVAETPIPIRTALQTLL